ncbi:hypothetical protein ADIAG_00562 [Paeniglutamicibacter gangotriensis Lz1y]|uniref:Uncharacterized protein n=1 Tax=Paeniglutamicibacter gangotriensis Lz1y TaxID=1276920 RepID=M7NFE8_9MICC|nr:hypothetical protein ADIAG_00562 [Paeniglutamicibacter gangotriensis Lz1y]
MVNAAVENMKKMPRPGARTEAAGSAETAAPGATGGGSALNLVEWFDLQERSRERPPVRGIASW